MQALTGHGAIGVVNRCRKGSRDGKVTMSKGKTTVADPTRDARLEVSLF